MRKIFSNSVNRWDCRTLGLSQRGHCRVLPVIVLSAEAMIQSNALNWHAQDMLLFFRAHRPDFRRWPNRASGGLQFYIDYEPSLTVPLPLKLPDPLPLPLKLPLVVPLPEDFLFRV